MTTNSKAGTYILSGGWHHDSVTVTLNSSGHLDKCDDMEQITSAPCASEPHRGNKAEFFDVGMGGHLFANAKFFANARKME